MKSVLSGLIAALFVAALAAFILEGEIQVSSEDRFQTTGVRL